jgi:hypothetical protein
MKSFVASVFCAAVIVSLFFTNPMMVSASANVAENPVSVTLDTKSPIYLEDSIAYNRLIHTSQSLHPIVNENGTISVINQFPDENTGQISIFEFSPQNVFVRKLDFQPILPKVGGFTKDDEGNFYIFYGKDVEEGAFSEQNMVLVKYSHDGVKMDEEWLKARDNEKTHIILGAKIPAFGEGVPCAIEISGDTLAVYMSYITFNDENGTNHQCAIGILFDLKTLEQKAPEDGLGIVYVSHSDKEYLLPIDGGFLSANLSDATPKRGFIFYSGGSYITHSFDFSWIVDTEYIGNFDAELGGVAETSDGYMALGTYSNGAIPRTVTSEGMGVESGGPVVYPRNVFLMRFKQEPLAESDESLQKQVDEYIWLTNYTNDEKVCVENPKFVALEGDRYLVMYVVDGVAYRLIVDGKGNVVAPLKALPENVQLCATFSVPRYNPVNKKVYWAVRTDNGTPYALTDDKGEEYLWGTHYTEMRLYAYDPYTDIPMTPAYIANPPKPAPLYAYPTYPFVTVNGKVASYEMYKVGSDDFYKLRDLAYALNSSNKQFAIGYDGSNNAITLTSGKAYTPTDGDMKQGDSTIKIAKPAASKIYLDGKELNIPVYTIGANNFVKVQDLMKALDVNVSIFVGLSIDTSKGYADE